MLLIEYINKLQANGQYWFNSLQAIQELNLSPNSFRLSIKRMKEKRLIVSPAKQFYLILPPEYSIQGCLPPGEFIPHLMKFWDMDYYVGLLSAAEFHGAAHQRPQRFQVLIDRYKPNIQCGKIGIQFIQNKKVRQTPTMKLNTPRSMLKISTPEATAIDLVMYQFVAGGLNHIATVLQELSEIIDADKLDKSANTIASTSCLQRLGYLFEFLKYDNLAQTIQKILETKKPQFIALANQITTQNAIRNQKWKLLINFEVELDL